MIDDFNASNENEEEIKPSKTKRKKEMIQLQALGEQLLTLKQPQLAKLSLPEELSDALALAKRIPKKEAQRRHLQYIGRLMRQVDEETLSQIKRLLQKLDRL